MVGLRGQSRGSRHGRTVERRAADLPPQPGRRIDLPLYPFQRQPYWASPRRTAPAARGAHALLGRRLRSGLAQIQDEAVLAPDQPAWLADHAVNGHVVVPAAALIEMMLAVSPVEGGIELTGIAFRRMLVPADQPLVQTVADPATGRLTIFAAADTDDAAFTLVATADWRMAGDVPDAALEAARGAAVRLVDLATLYARFAAAGLVYGPAFRTMTHLLGGDGIALAELAASVPGSASTRVCWMRPGRVLPLRCRRTAPGRLFPSASIV